MSKKATDIVSYITIIGWLIAYFAGDKEESRFHLNQGLVLFVIGTVVSIVIAILTYVLAMFLASSIFYSRNITVITQILFYILSFITIILSVATYVWNIFCFVCMIVGIINAATGKEKKLPLIGRITILKAKETTV